MDEEKGAANHESVDDFQTLQNKGALWILMALGLSDDRMTFTEIRDSTNLSNGTTQRRLEELHETGWIEQEAELDDSGRASKKYYLSEETKDMLNALKELGRTLLR